MVPCRVRTLWVVSVWGGGDACVVLLPSGRTAHRGAGARMQWASPARVVQGPCKHDKRELFYLENWIVVGPGSGGSSRRPRGPRARGRSGGPGTRAPEPNRERAWPWACGAVPGGTGVHAGVPGPDRAEPDRCTGSVVRAEPTRFAGTSRASRAVVNISPARPGRPKCITPRCEPLRPVTTYLKLNVRSVKRIALLY